MKDKNGGKIAATLLLLALSFLAGIVTAWFLREPGTALLLHGRTFDGRSPYIQAWLLAAYTSMASLPYFAAGRFWISRDDRPARALNAILNSIAKHAHEIRVNTFPPGGIQAALEFLRNHRELTVLLFLGFILRLFLAGQQSYWLDEFYSVQTYGYANRTVLDAIRNLAETSIHPPLYQFVLFYWMKLFGNSEAATRSLSSIYVTLAVLCIYLIARDGYGRRIAFAASLVFSLSYTAVYYSLETRSYAQSMFLCTLSSFLLLKYLDRLSGNFSWRNLFFNPQALWYWFVNACVLLTHYYNVFFVCSQGIFVLACFLRTNKLKNPLGTAGKVMAVFAAQMLPLLMIWGPVMAGSYREFGDNSAYSISVPSETPLSIFRNYVWNENTSLPVWIDLVILLLLISIVVKLAGKMRPDGFAAPPADRHFWYLLCWAALPSIFAYMAFAIGHFERYQPRYFTFLVPPMLILLILALQEGAALLSRLFQRLAPSPLSQKLQAGAPFLALLVALALVLPGGYQAALKPKADYRGIAREISNLVEHNPGGSYIIYESAYRRTPFLDYYLERFDSTVRVHGVVRKIEETRFVEDKTRLPGILQEKDVINGYDYLVVAFVYPSEPDFPQTTRCLAKQYPAHLQLLDKNGLGIIIYQVHPAAAAPGSAQTSSACPAE